MGEVASLFGEQAAQAVAQTKSSDVTLQDLTVRAFSLFMQG
jgi:hypothetical protein